MSRRPPLTRAKAGSLIDDTRMSSAQIRAALMQVGQWLDRIDSAGGELYEGICNEMPPDIEIQPRIVRSA